MKISLTTHENEKEAGSGDMKGSWKHYLQAGCLGRRVPIISTDREPYS